VLTFIGIKMLVVAIGFHIPIWFSLVFVATVLLGSVIASLLFASDNEPKIEVDLPPGFDFPLTDDLREHPKNEEKGTRISGYSQN
jgi:hypothetical protein